MKNTPAANVQASTSTTIDRPPHGRAHGQASSPTKSKVVSLHRYRVCENYWVRACVDPKAPLLLRFIDTQTRRNVIHIRRWGGAPDSLPADDALIALLRLTQPIDGRPKVSWHISQVQPTEQRPERWQFYPEVHDGRSLPYRARSALTCDLPVGDGALMRTHELARELLAIRILDEETLVTSESLAAIRRSLQH